MQDLLQRRGHIQSLDRSRYRPDRRHLSGCRRHWFNYVSKLEWWIVHQSNIDPSEWQHPPVPEAWWQTIRDHTPGYNPLTTPSRGLGVVPELLRTWPGARRSAHPAFSLAAVGPQAEYLTEGHALEEDSGDRSPLGKLYELDGHVLLLGVDHWSNTSLHLAEFRADYPGKRNLRTRVAFLGDMLLDQRLEPIDLLFRNAVLRELAWGKRRGIDFDRRVHGVFPLIF